MNISELAKVSKLPASTLRYYESIGLLKPVGRQGLKRYYGKDILERVSYISLGRQAGFSLEEIGTMLLGQKPRIDRSLLTEKANELDSNIKKMTKLRDGLIHAAKCPHENHADCRTFQRLLELALKKKHKGVKL